MACYTPIESAATKNNKMGTEKHWRKPDIIADAVLGIINENPFQFTGNQLIDEDYRVVKVLMILVNIDV